MMMAPVLFWASSGSAARSRRTRVPVVSLPRAERVALDTASDEGEAISRLLKSRAASCWDIFVRRVSRSPRPQRQPKPSGPADSPRKAECQQTRSEEHTSELQSRQYLVCRLLLEKKKKKHHTHHAANDYVMH